MADERTDIIFGKNSPRLSDILKLYESTEPDAEGHIEEWGSLRMVEHVLDNLDPEKKETSFAQLRGIFELLYNTIDRHYLGQEITPLDDHNQQGIKLGDLIIKIDFKGVEAAVEKAHKKALEIYSADKEKFAGIIYEEDLQEFINFKSTLNAPYEKVRNLLEESYVRLNDGERYENIFLVTTTTHKNRPAYEISINGSLVSKVTGTLDIETNRLFSCDRIKELYNTIDNGPYREELELALPDSSMMIFSGNNKGITDILDKVKKETMDNWKPFDVTTQKEGFLNIKKITELTSDSSLTIPYTALTTLKNLVRYQLLGADMVSREVLIDYLNKVTKENPSYLPQLAEMMEVPQLTEITKRSLSVAEKNQLFGEFIVTIVSQNCAMHTVDSNAYLAQIKPIVHMEKILNRMEADNNFPELKNATKNTINEMRDLSECYKYIIFVSGLIHTLSIADPNGIQISEAQNKIKFITDDGEEKMIFSWPREILDLNTIKNNINNIYARDPYNDIGLLKRFGEIKSMMDGLINGGVCSIPSIKKDFAEIEKSADIVEKHGLRTPADITVAMIGFIDGKEKFYHHEELVLWPGRFPRVKELVEVVHPDSGIELRFRDSRISGKEAGLAKQLEDTLKFHRAKHQKEVLPLMKILNVILLIESPEKGGNLQEIAMLELDGNKIGFSETPIDHRSIQKAIEMARTIGKDKGINLESDLNDLLDKFSSIILTNYKDNPIEILGQKSSQGTPLFTAVKMKEENSYKILISEKALEEDIGKQAKSGSIIIAMKNLTKQFGEIIEYYAECGVTNGKNSFELTNVQNGRLKDKLESMCGALVEMDDTGKLKQFQKDLTATKNNKTIQPKMSIMPNGTGFNITIAPGEKIDATKKEAMDIELEKMGFTITRGTNNIKIKDASLEQKELLQSVFMAGKEVLK